MHHRMPPPFCYIDHIYTIIFGAYNRDSQNTKTAVRGTLVPIPHAPWHDIPEDSSTTVNTSHSKTSLVLPVAAHRKCNTAVRSHWPKFPQTAYSVGRHPSNYLISECVNLTDILLHQHTPSPGYKLVNYMLLASEGFTGFPVLLLK
jgi:hypothetical protein